MIETEVVRTVFIIIGQGDETVVFVLSGLIVTSHCELSRALEATTDTLTAGQADRKSITRRAKTNRTLTIGIRRLFLKALYGMEAGHYLQSYSTTHQMTTR